MKTNELDLHWIAFKKKLLLKYPVVRNTDIDNKVRTDAELRSYLSQNRADVIKDIDEWLSLMD